VERNQLLITFYASRFTFHDMMKPFNPETLSEKKIRLTTLSSCSG